MGVHWLSAVAFLLLFFTAALGVNIVEVRHVEREEGVPGGRRRLIGPGSSPPTCRTRCGRCFPCRPVQVAIQPGRTVPMDYYPEAWRCKCHNKLFMP